VVALFGGVVAERFGEQLLAFGGAVASLFGDEVTTFWASGKF
jgi:hypothetical protein